MALLRLWLLRRFLESLAGFFSVEFFSSLVGWRSFSVELAIIPSFCLTSSPRSFRVGPLDFSSAALGEIFSFLKSAWGVGWNLKFGF